MEKLRYMGMDWRWLRRDLEQDRPDVITDLKTKEKENRSKAQNGLGIGIDGVETRIIDKLESELKKVSAKAILKRARREARETRQRDGKRPIDEPYGSDSDNEEENIGDGEGEDEGGDLFDSGMETRPPISTIAPATTTTTTTTTTTAATAKPLLAQITTKNGMNYSELTAEDLGKVICSVKLVHNNSLNTRELLTGKQVNGPGRPIAGTLKVGVSPRHLIGGGGGGGEGFSPRPPPLTARPSGSGSGTGAGAGGGPYSGARWVTTTREASAALATAGAAADAAGGDAGTGAGAGVLAVNGTPTYSRGRVNGQGKGHEKVKASAKNKGGSGSGKSEQVQAKGKGQVGSVKLFKDFCQKQAQKSGTAPRPPLCTLPDSNGDGSIVNKAQQAEAISTAATDATTGRKSMAVVDALAPQSPIKGQGKERPKKVLVKRKIKRLGKQQSLPHPQADSFDFTGGLSLPD
jgi:hypothetical protein